MCLVSSKKILLVCPIYLIVCGVRGSTTLAEDNISRQNLSYISKKKQEKDYLLKRKRRKNLFNDKWFF